MKLNANIYEIIRNLLKDRKDDCKTIHYVDLTNYAPNDYPPKELALLPNLIVWDPLTRFNMDLFCPHCHQDENIRNIVRPSTWCNRGKHTPRMLWDRGWWSALVGRFYTCNKNHNIVAYHFGFLKQLPLQMVPFMLTHAAGMTTSCYDLAIKLLEQGNSFAVIQNILEGMFVDTYERRRYLSSPTILPELDEGFVTAPSDQAIRQHFLMQFDSNKDLYQSQMDRIPFTQLHVVTNGDRFDVNIGVKEKGTAGPKNTYKWNKLFDSMFLIFNEFGCIKAYGLTKDICIDQIIQCLVALAPFNPDTEVISMSNYCCVSRESLIEAFPNANVVFDLDYAKDLLKEQIECHDEKHEIFKDLDNAFKTNLLTPSANQLQVVSHLNNFFTKWSKDDEMGGLLKDSFLEVLENILLHVRNGCVPLKGQELSRDKTKRIFEQLAKIFQPLFLGVQSACSLIAHIVYVYNCQKLGHKNNLPIWSHKESTPLESKDLPKGVESEQVLSTEVIESSENVESMSCSEQLEVINFSTVEFTEEEVEATLQEDTLETNLETNIKTEDIENNVHQAVLSQEFSEKSKHLLSLGKLFFNLREMVFKLPTSHYHKSMQKFVSLMVEVWFGHDYFKICSLYNIVYRDQLFTMKILGLKEIEKPATPIRPSLMYSIYLIIKEYHNNTKFSQKAFGWSTQAEFRAHVTEKGLIFGATEDITSNLEKLNKLLSREMIGEDEAHYNTLLIESKKKLDQTQKPNMKFIKAEVDLAIIFAASNVFGIPFIISPSCLEIPVLPIVPITNIWVVEPSFLLFDTGNGSYSAYVKDSPDKAFLPCLCGLKSRKKNNAGIKHCLFVTCSCFSSGRSCTSFCKCCKCANNKPPTKDSDNLSAEPTPKKKRARDYDFHRNVPIPFNVLSNDSPSTNQHSPSPQPSTVSTPIVIESISPQAMHHAFLDAFMYTLLKGDKMIRSENLVDVLHGMFLEVRGEVVVEPLSREDEFLQHLSEIDIDFIATWMKDNKKQRKHMRDFKGLCLKMSNSKNPMVSPVDSKYVADDASAAGSQPGVDSIIEGDEEEEEEEEEENETTTIDDDDDGGEMNNQYTTGEISIVVLDADKKDGMESENTENVVEVELVFDQDIGTDNDKQLGDGGEAVIDDSPTKVAIVDTPTPSKVDQPPVVAKVIPTRKSKRKRK